KPLYIAGACGSERPASLQRDTELDLIAQTPMNMNRYSRPRIPFERAQCYSPSSDFQNSFRWHLMGSVPITISGGAKMIKRTLACVALCGLMASGTLMAHHSLAGVYDMKKDMQVTGSLESIKFVNPHGSLTV